MKRGAYVETRPEIVVIAYCYKSVILYGGVEIEEIIMADPGMRSVMDIDRALHKAAFTEFAEQVIKYRAALFCLILMKLVIVHAEVVGLQLYPDKLRVSGRI